MNPECGIAVETERFPGPGRVELRVRSAALGRTAEVRLLTPAGWTPRPDRHWPTLYLLHGGDDGPACWTEHTDIARLARTSGVLVVLPEGGRAGFYTDWRRADRSGSVPDWPRFHLDEVRPLLERRYGAGPARAIGGVSMGGYGALVYAARNPGMFAAAASYSGLVHTTRRGVPTLLRLYLRSVGERIDAMWGPRHAERTRWAKRNPYLLARGLAATPLYLSAGTGVRVPGDQPAPGDRLLERLIAPGSRDLAARLAELGCPPRTSFGPGTHYWPSWRRELIRSWGFFLTAFRSRAAGAVIP
ncbi:alpha/beta hydrolase [Amycolatopsis kentuckyensis]|uniref:alpha/beta hydrolase n=1 Tax=Amycolatopsis kentuckyensis TaxID=218823 RepID=UPI00130219F7|nr:alpha/beta hydrolase family protein [Amycolatopsis kentuckyensis]